MHMTTTLLNTLAVKQDIRGNEMIQAWSYWIVRPTALLVASQWLLLIVVLACTVWGNQSLLPVVGFYGSVGLILLLLTLQLSCHINRLGDVIVAPNAGLFACKVLSSLAMAVGLLVPFFVAFPGLFPGYGWAASAILISALLLLILRPLLYWLIRQKRFVEGLLILGTGDLAKRLCDELANKHDKSANPLPHFGTFVAPGQSVVAHGTVINYEELPAITRQNRISRIVVEESGTQGNEGLAVALLDCKLAGLVVEQASESYEQLSGKIWLNALQLKALVHSEGFRPSRHYLLLKRICDLVLSLCLLVVTAPLLAAIFILIKLDSVGPVLLRQVRVGRHGREFVLLKFRTMRDDAERHTGPVWACEQDDRVTRVGKYLRKYRLDELPQALNVLRGEMSLVGPRPERPYFVDILSARIPYYGLRHLVKPGITGWAQVLYPYGASVEDAYEKLQYDLYYAKRMSPSFDVRILLSTVEVILFGRGQ